LSATFETASLRVDGTMRDGKLDAHELTTPQQREIEHTLQTAVLKTREYPLARYDARVVPNGRDYSLVGELELAGRRLGLSVDARKQGDFYVAEVDLVPSRWGIRQYSALFSTLRVADRVRVAARFRPASDGTNRDGSRERSARAAR
jgi:hypothetical protein